MFVGIPTNEVFMNKNLSVLFNHPLFKDVAEKDIPVMVKNSVPSPGSILKTVLSVPPAILPTS